MKRKGLFLIGGLVVTLLVLIFSTVLFENLYYEREFSNEMYNQNLNFIVAVVTCIVAWAVAGLYYYGINSVSFSRWYHWLIMLVVASALSAIINYVYPNNIFSDEGLNFSAQLFSFCLVDFVLTAVMFIIASFSIRWWSSNCRHTPIPE